MGRKSNQTVRVVIVNPEAIEAAKEKFTEFIYQKYKEHLAKNTPKEEHNK